MRHIYAISLISFVFVFVSCTKYSLDYSNQVQFNVASPTANAVLGMKTNILFSIQGINRSASYTIKSDSILQYKNGQRTNSFTFVGNINDTLTFTPTVLGAITINITITDNSSGGSSRKFSIPLVVYSSFAFNIFPNTTVNTPQLVRVKSPYPIQLNFIVSTSSNTYTLSFSGNDSIQYNNMSYGPNSKNIPILLGGSNSVSISILPNTINPNARDTFIVRSKLPQDTVTSVFYYNVVDNIILTTPFTNAQAVPLQPIFSWQPANPSIGSVSYNILASTSLPIYNNTANRINNTPLQNPLDTFRTSNTTFSPNVKYYWEVQAVNGLGTILGESDIDSFTIRPTIVFPTAGGRSALVGMVDNGKLYFVGGYNNSTNYFKDILVYDTMVKAFVSPQPSLSLSVPTAFAGGVAMGNNLYIAGGNNDKNILNVIAQVNIVSGQTSTIPFPNNVSPRSALAVAAFGSKIYLIGGITTNSPMVLLNTIDVYDTLTKTFATPSIILSTGQVSNLAAVVNDANIYIAGGIINSSSTPTATVNVLNANSNIFTSPSYTLPTARAYLGATQVGTNLYFSGAGSSNDLVDVFNTQTKIWSQLSPLPLPSGGRINMAVVSIGNLIFFAGGENNGTYFNQVDVYNTATQQWQ